MLNNGNNAAQNVNHNLFFKNISSDPQGATIVISGNPSWNYNNYMANGTKYDIYNANTTPGSITNSESNWWGTTNEGKIQGRIYDFFDDGSKGIVDYSPFLTSPDTNAPISPPSNVNVNVNKNIINLTWSLNPESDLKGYKVYWDTQEQYPFANSADVGNVTSYTLTRLPPGTYYVAVTAYDNDYDPANDDPATIVNENQTNGNESWYATFTVNITIPFTIATNPSGLQIMVDGSTYTAPHTFDWTPGSSHNLSVSSPQSGTSGTRYVYSSWSDGGTQTHSINAPSSSTSYTASLTTQYSLTTSVNPSGAGTITPSGTNWYDSGQNVSISPTANPGYTFGAWSGDVLGATNPTSIGMNGPKSIVVNFTQNQYTLTVNIAPSGSGAVTKSPDKAFYTYGEQLILTATANAGYTFNKWTGDATGSTNPVTVTLSAQKNIFYSAGRCPPNKKTYSRRVDSMIQSSSPDWII